jgi:hypothetical protein
MQRRSGRRSHGPGLAGSVMPFPDLPWVPLFFRSLDGPRLIASLAPAQLALKGCATAQAKPCLPPLGGPRWYKSYFPPFLFMSSRFSPVFLLYPLKTARSQKFPPFLSSIFIRVPLPCQPDSLKNPIFADRCKALKVTNKKKWLTLTAARAI